MVLPRIDTCCFIFDLRTGNIILGSINATFSFILTVIMIVVTSQIEFPKHDEDNNITEKDKAYGSAFAHIYVLCIILVLLYLIKFIFDVVFIYGVVKGRLATIKSYFICWTVFFVISVISFMWHIGKLSVSAIFVEILYIGINIYVILLGSSFYQQLKSTQIV